MPGVNVLTEACVPPSRSRSWPRAGPGHGHAGVRHSSGRTGRFDQSAAVGCGIEPARLPPSHARTYTESTPPRLLAPSPGIHAEGAQAEY
jgi:hypothetical protein